MHDDELRSDRRRSLRDLGRRLEQLLTFRRDLAWHPRLSVVLARDIGRTRRELELLRRQGPR